MMAELRHLLALLVSVSALSAEGKAASPSFTIDYEHDTFLKDGQPIQIVSGSIHYFRVHPTDWADRLYKLRYAGFNTVETYIEWATSEPEPGELDFSGLNNFTAYLEEAQRQDLLVILRPGPFIAAERGMGGLPYWLLRENPDMVLRTADPSFLQYVDKWLGDAILPKVKPYLYSEGGPVIMVQVGNEYGWISACDYEYTTHLRDLFRSKLGEDIVLITNDGHGTDQLRCGKIPEVYATVDYGTSVNASEGFKYVRLFEPEGPLMCAESYPGWFDFWGYEHSKVATEVVTSHWDSMLAMGASVSMYMFHGGTSFGLRPASNTMDGALQPITTSYDYDAPLSECGDLTQKYFAMRDVVGKYVTLPDMTAPKNSSKAAYGDVLMTETLDLFQQAEKLTPVQSVAPLSFEVLKLSNGIVIYETTITVFTTDPAILDCGLVSDRGYVYLDGKMLALLSRSENAFAVPIKATMGQKLTVVVESMGRPGSFNSNNETMKGIIGDVTLGGKTLENWNNTAIDLSVLTEETKQFGLQLSTNSGDFKLDKGQMTFYNGSFSVADEPEDTFLRLDGWNKGVAYINDFCIGRYWPVMGPQVTLYVPHGLLHKGDNLVTLLELEGAPCSSAASCKVAFTDKHVIDGPAPKPAMNP